MTLTLLVLVFEFPLFAVVAVFLPFRGALIVVLIEAEVFLNGEVAFAVILLLLFVFELAVIWEDGEDGDGHLLGTCRSAAGNRCGHGAEPAPPGGGRSAHLASLQGPVP